MQARQKLGEKLISVLAEDFEVHGEATIRRLREEDPSTYTRIVASLLPRAVEMTLQQQTPIGIDPGDWQLLIGIAATMRQIAPNADLAEVETALRSHFAKPAIEG